MSSGASAAGASAASLPYGPRRNATHRSLRALTAMCAANLIGKQPSGLPQETAQLSSHVTESRTHCMLHTRVAIRVGISGWRYAPWRGVFYPSGLPHAAELVYAGEVFSTLEING